MPALDKEPRSLFEMTMPGTANAVRSFAPGIRKAYQQGGAGAAVGQTLRGGINTIAQPLLDTGRAVSGLAGLANEYVQQPASRAVSQAIKTAVTGDASPIAAATAAPADAVTQAAPTVAPPPASLAALAAAPVMARAAAPIPDPDGPLAENSMRMGKKTVSFGPSPTGQETATVPTGAAPTSLERLRDAPRVVSVDITQPEVQKVRAGGMISQQVADLINQKNARNAEARADQREQAAVTAANTADAPMRSALATMAVQANDPLRKLDAAGKQQDLERGRLSLADANTLASLKAKIADPKATPEERAAAATSLRQLAGKEHEVKVATEQGADGQRVSYVINADGSAVPVAEAAQATKERALQKTATKQIPQGQTKASMLSWAKQQLESQKNDPRIKEMLTNELAAYGIAF